MQIAAVGFLYTAPEMAHKDAEHSEAHAQLTGIYNNNRENYNRVGKQPGRF